VSISVFLLGLKLIWIRNAVDFGLPLLNNAQCAKLFVDALKLKVPQGGLRPYTEGKVPTEVRSWSEYVGYKA
jgi:carbamoyl-phosphate synthase large subunit